MITWLKQSDAVMTADYSQSAEDGVAGDDAYAMGDAQDRGEEQFELDGQDEDPSGLRAANTAGPDSVRCYLRELRKWPLLTFQEEQALGKRIAAGDLEARTRMIESNLRLVVVIAKKYVNRGISFPDVVAEGNLGLIRAVEKFDYRKGIRLSTYASRWIKQYIERAFINHVSTVRLPVHIAQIGNRYQRTVKQLAGELKREPTTEEIAGKMCLSVAKVRSISQAVRETLSLQTIIGDKDEDTLESRLEDSATVRPDSHFENIRRRARITGWLSELSQCERRVIEQRFGLNDDEPKTLDCIGKEYKITRERVRQIERVALNKLRAMMRRENIGLEVML